MKRRTLPVLISAGFFILLATGVAAAFLAGRGTRVVQNYAGGVLALVVVVFLARTLGLGGEYYEYLDFERISELRSGRTYKASSAFMVDTDISTPAAAAAFLPLGLLYFLLAPFP